MIVEAPKQTTCVVGEGRVRINTFWALPRNYHSVTSDLVVNSSYISYLEMYLLHWYLLYLENTKTSDMMYCITSGDMKTGDMM